MFGELETYKKRIYHFFSNYLTSPTVWIWILITMLIYELILGSIKLLNNWYMDIQFRRLCLAVKRKRKSIVSDILDKYPEFVNRFGPSEGYTPFMIACATAEGDIVNLMLAKGANVNLKSKYDEGPFHLAVIHHLNHTSLKDEACLQALSGAGAKLSERGPDGLDALQLAAYRGHVWLAKWLLFHNVKIRPCPHPYLLAKTYGHLDVARLIKFWVQIRFNALKCIKAPRKLLN